MLYCFRVRSPYRNGTDRQTDGRARPVMPLLGRCVITFVIVTLLCAENRKRRKQLWPRVHQRGAQVDADRQAVHYEPWPDRVCRLLVRQPRVYCDRLTAPLLVSWWNTALRRHFRKSRHSRYDVIAASFLSHLVFVFLMHNQRFRASSFEILFYLFCVRIFPIHVSVGIRLYCVRRFFPSNNSNAVQLLLQCTLDMTTAPNILTLSVIGVEESNADAVRDCSYVKAIVWAFIHHHSDISRSTSGFVAEY